MADNVAITAGSGTTIAADDIGAGVLVQRVKPVVGADGTGVDVSASAPMPVNDYVRCKDATASAMTRPANTTPYTANDAVSNNATAGSVSAISVTLADVNDAPLVIRRGRLATTDTGLASAGVLGKAFRVWLYRADPTASSGIVGGDNAAFSTKQGSFIGTLVGNFYGFSDGAVAMLAPEVGVDIVTSPVSGAQTIFALLQTLEDFTPSANSTTFTLTLEALQGRP